MPKIIDNDYNREIMRWINENGVTKIPTGHRTHSNRSMKRACGWEPDEVIRYYYRIRALDECGTEFCDDQTRGRTFDEAWAAFEAKYPEARVLEIRRR